MPYTKQKQIEQLAGVLFKIVSKPARESIYAKNLNPIRCGFLLYQLIADIKNNKGFSVFTCQRMLDQIEH